MEWKTRELPKSGQTRERLKFAWWPIDCEDGKTRWLRKVRVVEQYLGAYEGLGGHWVPNWITRKVYRAEFEINPSRLGKW